MSIDSAKEWFWNFGSELDGPAMARGHQYAPRLTDMGAERIAERARAYEREQHQAGNYITTAEAVRHVTATEADPAIIAARARAYQQKQRELGNEIDASEAVRRVTSIENLRSTIESGGEVDAAMVAELARLWQGRAASLGMHLSAAEAVHTVKQALLELGARFPE